MTGLQNKATQPANTVPSGADAGQQIPQQEHVMELLIGYLLLAGVLASVTLLIIGLVWQKIITGHFALNYLISGMNLFQFVVSDFRTLLGDASFGPRIFVNLGIAALLLTPFIRVVASVFFFALAERNWKYTLFTLFVASVLTYSLFLR